MWHQGWSGWWVLMPLAMTALLGALVWAVVNIGRPPQGSRPHASDTRTEAERLLDIRYARGEIEEEVYRHRLDVLRGAATPTEKLS